MFYVIMASGKTYKFEDPKKALESVINTIVNNLNFGYETKPIWLLEGKPYAEIDGSNNS